MLRIYFAFFVILSCFCISESHAQTVCGMATDEPDGCLMETNRYTGVTNVYTNSPLLSGIDGPLCMPAYQDSWLQFVPLCDEVTFKFLAIGCIPRIATYGINVAVLDENFEVIDNCFKFRVVGFQNQRFNLSGLTPGKKYHLMVFTGIPGQRCNYTFEIEGLSLFGISNNGIHGVFDLGAGSLTKFYVDTENPGTQYNWTADAGVDIVAGQGTPTIQVSTPTSGTYQLCCEIIRTDGTVENHCETITVNDTSDIIQYEQQMFCKGGCHDFFGDCLDVGGEYFHDEVNAQGKNVKHFLELCQDPEPRVGIYGEPLITVQSEFVPSIINGYLKRGNPNDYSFQWLNGQGRPINGANDIQFSIDRSRTLCFVATSNITGCSDTTCTDVEVLRPVPEACTPTNPPTNDPPGCAMCTSTFFGSTAGYSQGPRPTGFCGTIQNNQYIAFQAQSTTVSIDIETWDCLRLNGVQMVIVDENLNVISTCYNSGGNPSMGNITASGLTPGQVYYIMVDGWSGDICNFSLTIVGGVNFNPPDPPQQIEADKSDPCPGEVVCYQIPPVNNASLYTWTVPSSGQILVGQGSNEICVQWSGSGTADVCVIPSNPCFESSDTCLQVNIINSTAVNNVPPMEFCAYEFPLAESDYCPGGDCPGAIPSAGTYCVNVGPTAGACDSTVCYTFMEIPVSTTVIDTFVCFGRCLDFYGTDLCDAGTYNRRVQTNAACDDVIEWRVQSIDIKASIDNPRPYDCIAADTMWLMGNNSTFSGGTEFLWEAIDGGVVEDGANTPTAIIRGAGRYALTLKFGDGGGACVSRDTVTVMGNIDPPMVFCNSTGNSVTFSWPAVPGALSYTIDVDGAGQGRITDTTYTVTGLVPLQPVTFSIRANGVAGCTSIPATVTCNAQNCPTVTMSIDSLPPFCLSNPQPVQLQYQVVGATGTGIINWLGTGVDINGVFDPSQANIGDNIINVLYEENGCNYFATRVFKVVEQPTATFDVETPICITRESEIRYTGNAVTTADYNWNFDNGVNISSASGSGPYFIKWNTAGDYNVRLTVTENGCISDQVSEQVQIIAPLPKPVLQCNTTTSSIEITWADVPGATDYRVNLIAGNAGTRTNNSYQVNNLSPGDEVEIEVIVTGNNICGSSSETITCRAADCPPVQVGIGQISDICLTQTTADFDLNDFLLLSGNSNAATIEWEINGTMTTGGICSPTTLGVGQYDIQVTVIDSGCPFNAAGVVNIKTVPAAAFTVTSPVCIGENATINFTSPVLNNSIFRWDFDNGTENSGNTNEGPYELTFSNAGSETITVEVEADGCLSNLATESIQVTEPIPTFNIGCNSSTTTIDFNWPPSTNATNYEVQVLNAPSTAVTNQPDDFSFNVTNLNPQEEVTIQVEVSDANSTCPPTVVTETCIALDCPPLPPFVVNCGSTTEELTFTWNPVAGATDYDVTILDMPASATTNQPDDFTFVVSNLNPLDGVTIRVDVSSDNDVCLVLDALSNCQAKDCPPIQITTLPIPQECLDEGAMGTEIDLLDFVQITGDNGNARINWFSSSPLNGSRFQPNGNDFNIHIFAIEIIEEGCTFTEALTMDVVKIPSSAFTVETPICITERSRVQLDNTPAPNTNFRWDFGSSTDQLGAQPTGPFSLIWGAATSDQISLTTERNGCTSEETTMPIQIDATLEAPIISCSSDLTEIEFTWAPVVGATNYDVTIDNAPSGFSNNQPSDFSLQITDILPMEDVTITVTANDPSSACPPIESSFTCQTAPCPVMTLTFDAIPDVCLSDSLSPIDLNDYLTITGDLQNGTTTWSGSGANGNGIFDANASGVGTHLMVVDYRELNCETRQTIEITVHPTPDADAGVDVVLSCLDSIANLGGSRNANNDPSVTYNWTGGNVDNANNFITQTSDPSTYLLTATNPITGCFSTDEVIVSIGAGSPQLRASVDDISCFGYNDGTIRVDTVIGGTPPLLYSLNDNPFLTHSVFSNLGPGDYTITVQDAIGCESEITFSIAEPDELTVELVIIANEIPVPFGDSVQLLALSNYAPQFLNSVEWSPADNIPICDETNITDCLSIFVTPTGQTVYTVRVEHINGCAASDNGEVYVSKEKGLYIPSAFSPTNRDGVNDIFRIYANMEQVVEIRSFTIINRWGEMMHQVQNFLPIDDSHGWNGHFRGKPLNPNVFVFMVEVEYFDGSIELIKGDVTLTW